MTKTKIKILEQMNSRCAEIRVQDVVLHAACVLSVEAALLNPEPG